MTTDIIRRPALLATIFAFNLIAFVHSGMIAFATGPIMGQIGASPEEYSVITALYASVAVVSISQMTVLIQRLGWRDYLLGSVLLFLIGAWVCAGSGAVASFTLGRMLMAFGGGGFMSAARMLVNFIQPPVQRIAGIAAFGVSLTAGLAAGPWLAGVMVGREAGSGMFLLLAVLATCTGGLALRYMPADGVTLDATRSRFSLADGMALGGAAFLILYGLQRLVYDWHGERAQVLVPLSCGSLLAVWFFLSHGRSAEPFLRLEMLRSRRFVTGLLIYALCYLLLGGFNTLMPQLIQRVLGVAFEQAGQMQGAGLSGAILAVVIKLVIVRRRPHATKFYVVAFLLLAGFGWHFSNLDPRVPAWTDIVPWTAAFGAFIVLGMATTALHSFKDLQHDNVLFSHAQQFKNMLAQIALALGVGGTNIVLQERGALHAARLAESSSAPAAVLMQQGSLLASVDAFRMMTWIALAAAVALAVQRRFD